MTILASDLKMLAADSLVTSGDSKVYHRSKIRILKQTAIATAGDESDGFRFEAWYFAQNGETFTAEDSFQAIVFSKDRIQIGETKDDSNELTKLWDPMAK